MTCDDELVNPTHTGAQWELKTILSQPEKGRDDVAIKIWPLDALGDSQLSDAQYAKAMSKKAEQESKESKKSSRPTTAAVKGHGRVPESGLSTDF